MISNEQITIGILCQECAKLTEENNVLCKQIKNSESIYGILEFANDNQVETIREFRKATKELKKENEQLTKENIQLHKELTRPVGDGGSLRVDFATMTKVLQVNAELKRRNEQLVEFSDILSDTLNEEVLRFTKENNTLKNEVSELRNLRDVLTRKMNAYANLLYQLVDAVNRIDKETSVIGSW